MDFLKILCSRTNFRQSRTWTLDCLDFTDKDPAEQPKTSLEELTEFTKDSLQEPSLHFHPYSNFTTISLPGHQASEATPWGFTDEEAHQRICDSIPCATHEEDDGGIKRVQLWRKMIPLVTWLEAQSPSPEHEQRNPHWLCFQSS